MLKKIFIYAALFISSIATAADKSNSIAIVNIEKLKTETKAAQSIAQQINDLQIKFQEKITKIEKEFEAKKQTLDKQRTVLSKEAFAKKEAEFNNKIVEARNELKKEAGNIEQMQQTASIEFDTIAFETTRAIAKENNYSHVFAAGYMLYFDPRTDITSLVIAGMDKKIDSIALKAPATK
jgi:outer membrane protein